MIAGHEKKQLHVSDDHNFITDDIPLITFDYTKYRFWSGIRRRTPTPSALAMAAGAWLVDGITCTLNRSFDKLLCGSGCSVLVKRTGKTCPGEAGYAERMSVPGSME